MTSDTTAASAPDSAHSRTTGNRRLSAVLLLAGLTVGCSITSSPSNVDHMRCIKAHDEKTSNETWTPVCDLYSPLPEPTR